MSNLKPKGWIKKPSPKNLKIGTGWFGEIDTVFVDEGKNYCVMIRTVNTEWGEIYHACMRNKEDTDIPWREKQRIKNEIFGTEKTAIEVFPAESNLVDKANMYHIWVLPEKFKLPFGLEL